MTEKISGVCICYDSRDGNCVKPEALLQDSRGLDAEFIPGDVPSNMIAGAAASAERSLQSFINPRSLIEKGDCCYLCRARPPAGGIDRKLPGRQKGCVYYSGIARYRDVTVTAGQTPTE